MKGRSSAFGMAGKDETLEMDTGLGNMKCYLSGEENVQATVGGISLIVSAFTPNMGFGSRPPDLGSSPSYSVVKDLRWRW